MTNMCGVLHAVEMADDAGAVINPRVRHDFFIGNFLLRCSGVRWLKFFGFTDSPAATRRPGGQIGLQRLHCAGLVMVVQNGQSEL